ncbi:MAG: PQQ-dependent sugar dehydrogenase, partial [Planctomycetota bacterium]
ACLRFGPDGYLYVCTGDGSRPFPPDRYHTAQDISDVRGSVLRIDVHQASREQPYRIPADNPFVDRDDARGEIYAFGLRNGFRAAFHPETDRLWVADVGWERCELIHRIERGGNHGWSLFEGPHPVNLEQPSGPGRPILPAIVLSREQAQSVTGGPFLSEFASMVRHDPSLKHQYVFGCFMNGVVWTADVSQPDAPQIRVVAETGLKLIDFKPAHLAGSSEDSDLLMVDFAGGGIYRLVPYGPSSKSESFPKRLSETGLFSETSTLQPALGVWAYRPEANMYRGGATGSRVIGIPKTDPSSVGFPTGTAVALTLSRSVENRQGELEPRRIETQLLVFNGLTWDPYTYRWNEDQADALLVASAGDRMDIVVDDPVFGRRKIEHVFASRKQCLVCHNVSNQGPITLTAANLWNMTSNDAISKALASWKHFIDLGVVANVKPKAEASRLVNPMDDSQSLAARARSYLDVNCSACHRPAGGAMSPMHLRRTVRLSETGLIDAEPAQGNFAIDNARIIRPGHPEQSVLIYRLATAGPGAMPKQGWHEPDIDGAKLLWEWIESMDPGQVTSDAATVDLATSQALSTSDALLRWRSLADVDARLARQRAERVMNDESDPAIQGLFQRWLAEEARRIVVGESPDFDALLQHDGDASEGQRWYAGGATSQCRHCHRVRSNESLIGPSLAGIAQRRTPRQILEHIAKPSLEIPDPWKTFTVLTVDGEIISGLKDTETETLLTLKASDGKIHAIRQEEIESVRTDPRSLMPEGLLASMTAQEVANLLAFLLSLP